MLLRAIAKCATTSRLQLRAKCSVRQYHRHKILAILQKTQGERKFHNDQDVEIVNEDFDSHFIIEKHLPKVDNQDPVMVNYCF